MFVTQVFAFAPLVALLTRGALGPPQAKFLIDRPLANLAWLGD